MDNKHFYLGIDGGGTKSRCLLKFADGTEVLLQGGPMNICSVSQEQVAENLAVLFRQAEQHAGSLSLCKGVGIGVAGFTNNASPPFFRSQVEKWFPGVPMMLDTDGAAALFGAHGAPEGIVLIAGTGSVCFGIHGDRKQLTGGGGHLIDDEGSGYAIGRDICTAVMKAQDGRGRPTVLSDLLKEAKGVSVRSDLMTFVYHPDTGKQGIAALAPLLTEACNRGDEEALAIADKAAENLVEMVSAVVRRLDMPRGPLSFSGSILTKQPHILEKISKKLDETWPDMIYYPQKQDAAYGAVLMAQWAAQKEEGVI